MKFDEIMKFLDSGLSVSEIQQIIDKENSGQQSNSTDNSKDKNTADNSANNETSNDTEKIPAWAEMLNNNISALTKTMQANAIMNSNMNVAMKTVSEQADDILANIINPTTQAKG